MCYFAATTPKAYCTLPQHRQKPFNPQQNKQTKYGADHFPLKSENTCLWENETADETTAVKTTDDGFQVMVLATAAIIWVDRFVHCCCAGYIYK